MSQHLGYLASASPRRTALLSQVGIEHRVQPADIDESINDAERPGDYVARLAAEKARAVANACPHGSVVLGADTTVVLDERILGKPEHREHAREMLAALSGREHSVMTGVAVVSEHFSETLVVETRVAMRAITDSEIEAYWACGEPQGKAGAYAIQGKGALFVERIDGSYSNVVGLPLAHTAELLARAGVALWPEASTHP